MTTFQRRFHNLVRLPEVFITHGRPRFRDSHEIHSNAASKPPKPQFLLYTIAASRPNSTATATGKHCAMHRPTVDGTTHILLTGPFASKRTLGQQGEFRFAFGAIRNHFNTRRVSGRDSPERHRHTVEGRLAQGAGAESPVRCERSLRTWGPISPQVKRGPVRERQTAGSRRQPPQEPTRQHAAPLPAHATIAHSP